MTFTEIRTKFIDTMNEHARIYNERADSMWHGPMSIEEKLGFETARGNHLVGAIAAILSELARREENVS